MIAKDLIEKSFAIVEDFLPLEIATTIEKELKSFYNQGLMKPAGVAGHGPYEHRKDLSYWIDEGAASPELGEFFLAIDFLSREFNESLGLPVRQREFHAAVYPVGAYYSRHKDVLRSTSPIRARRLVSCVYYLNPGWQEADGGELLLYSTSGAQKIRPEFNRLVMFLSEGLEHEVMPANRERRSLTGWLKSAGL